MPRTKWCNIWICLLLILESECFHQTFNFPSFLPSRDNYTVSVGKDVTFTCNVQNVGDHKVAWIRMSDKTVLSIHGHVFPKDSRLQVPPFTEPNYMSSISSWPLTIKGVTTADSGSYMCQLSTTPTLSQTSHLTVLTPPDIDDIGFSGDQVINEGDNTTLTCQATGNPQPKVSFKREDNRPLKTKSNLQARKLDGNELVLTGVSRQDAGAYLCIASNGVPPLVSRRIVISVTFPPSVSASNQLIASPLKAFVKLDCSAQSFPKATISWYHQKGDKIIPRKGYQIVETSIGSTEVHSSLIIERVSIMDFGAYTCLAVNKKGKAETTIRLHEIPATPSLQEDPFHEKKDHGIFKKSRDSIVHSEYGSSHQDKNSEYTTKISFSSKLKLQTSNMSNTFTSSGPNVSLSHRLYWLYTFCLIIYLYYT
ncbi:protein amalgam-like isoform X2 [Artemia franciscana]|uniref:protein amalgam-like isoform X2 n=1 Tax=Artemia franciscana TaxID=6661 RepID=UPI0032DA3527